MISTLTIDYTKLDNVNDYEKVLDLVVKYTFDQIEELIAPNQPKDNLQIYTATSLIGSMYMIRKANRGTYYNTKAAWSFKHLTNSSIQYLDPQ